MQYLTRVTGEEYIIMLSLILIKSDGTDFFVFLRSIYIYVSSFYYITAFIQCEVIKDFRETYKLENKDTIETGTLLNI